MLPVEESRSDRRHLCRPADEPGAVQIIGALESCIAFLTFLYIAYNGLMALPGLLLRPKRWIRVPGHVDERRFLILVAAHNEERVIRETVLCLRALDYPQDLVRLVVLSDNSTDATASVARAAGAEVWVRNDAARRGKGHAVRWALERARRSADWQAVLLLDADNLVDPHLLCALDARLRSGEGAIQAYLDSKNPTDNWLSLSYAMGYWGASRIYQFARTALGLSAQLGGTGFCLSREIVEAVGWPAVSLTEDLELTMRLVLGGCRVTWAHEARVYDEKPVSLRVAWRQRVRWMQGHTFISRKLTMALLARFATTGDLAALDAVLYLWAPTLQVVGIVWTFSWLAVVALGLPIPVPVLPLSGFAAMALAIYGVTAAGLLVERRGWALRNLPGHLFAGLIWWLTTCVGWARNGRQDVWVHTPHTRSLSSPTVAAAGATTAEPTREAGVGT